MGTTGAQRGKGGHTGAQRSGKFLPPLFLRTHVQGRKKTERFPPPENPQSVLNHPAAVSQFPERTGRPGSRSQHPATPRSRGNPADPPRSAHTFPLLLKSKPSPKPPTPPNLSARVAEHGHAGGFSSQRLPVKPPCTHPPLHRYTPKKVITLF